VESYRTEEEQVEALKRWWQENGRTLVIAVAVALSLGFGWQAWQANRTQQAAAASALYQRMLEALDPAAEGQATQARELAAQLKSEHGSTAYARFAGLHLARMAVLDGDLNRAESELRWVLSKVSKGSDLQTLAQLRLARVVAARGEAEDALAMLDAADPGAYAPLYAMARGDILMAADRSDEARAAYASAESALAAEAAQGPALLEQKLDYLNPVPPRAQEG
jgi:predicted negative regulator of RcsB-dependent stress response